MSKRLLTALQSVLGVHELTANFSRYMLEETHLVAHEIAHAIDYGDDFEKTLEDLPTHCANHRELAALRIEVAALRELGVRISLRRLWTQTYWYGDSDGPCWCRASAPLTKHEQRCVRRFVREVRAAMEAP